MIRRARPFGSGGPLVYLLALVTVIITLGPVVYGALGGFRSNEQLASDPSGLPDPWVFSNYTAVLTNDAFWRYALNSTIVALVTTVVAVLFGVMAAYPLARYQFKGREPLFMVFVLGLLFPAAVAIIPLFILVSRNLHLANTWWGVALPQAAFALPITVVILRPFLMAIPRELEEAALMDGASRIGIFWRLVVPLSMPALVTVGVLAFVASWNAYLLPLLLLQDDMRTLPLGVADYSSEHSSDTAGVLAFTTLAMIPALILFLAMQRRIVSGLQGAGEGMSGRVTMHQVAAEAGVSISTVSKVMNGRYGVSSQTFDHVTAVVNRLGYETSLVARSLRNTRTNVIGLLVADFEPFSTEVLKGAADAIRGTGYELVAYSAGGRFDEHVGWERRYLSRVMGTLVDGAVLVTPTVTDVQYDGPVVAVDPHTGRSSLPTVAADNLQGARMGVDHLLSLGHRRIGMVTGRADLVSAQLRERGYREAHAAAGVPIDEELLVLGAFDPEQAREAARTLLRMAEPPSAIFAANDISALSTLEVAAELGVEVPAQLSVVGFDNIPESALAHPSLTTVQQPMRQMGHDAIAMLVALIAGEQLEETHVTLETTLVLRRTTATLGDPS